jgi:hypothetical protein
MFKRSLVVLATTFVAAHAHALTAGDIAFTTFNADEDGWAIVALADIASNTTIFFRDDEYNGAWIDANESSFEWNTGAALISAGTVVRFSAIDTPARSAAFGTLVSGGTGTNFGLSASAETLYAYQGASAAAPTTFLTAVVSETLGTLLTGTGLSVGVNAVQIATGTDFGEYTGARSGQAEFADYKPLVFSTSNWTVNTSTDAAATQPNLTNFTVPSAVPEPSTYALMLAGLGGIALLARRGHPSR